MSALEPGATACAVLALGIPSALVATATLSPRRAGAAIHGVLGAATLLSLCAALLPGASAAQAIGVRVDVVTCVMLLLVGALGAVVVRYSQTYLQGDPGFIRYQRWLLLTLAAVTTLVVAESLLVVALGWIATSVALHQLLTFYEDRPAALIAAHKKFLVSRLADICLVFALVLVHGSVGGFALGSIAAWALAHPELSPSMHLASVLLVVAVALRTAQLPFHGWLMQVMEAPTPVSALLHAGVVNIGGFVLIRLAPWMAEAWIARWLLLGIGLLSAVVAALVMNTRITVKVTLAWSTCAQMGFMLVECALGLWHLALLHLVAHSIYKAYAFLSAGTAVEEWRLSAMTARVSPSGRSVWASALAVMATASAVVALTAQVAGRPVWGEPAVAVLSSLVALSTVPLLIRRAPGAAATAALAVRVGGVVMVYAAWHIAAERLLPSPVVSGVAAGWMVVGAAFVGLFVAKSILAWSPNGTFARAVQPWLFAGLYLDERFTRLTFLLWPPRIPRAFEPSGERAPRPLEART